MERPTFEAMLDAAAGVQRNGDEFSVEDGYSVALYVGEAGQAMEVSEVESIKLDEPFCQATSREHGTVYFVEYSSLHGLRVRPPSRGAGRRAGFS